MYDKRAGKNLPVARNCTEVFINSKDDISKIVTDISNKIKLVQKKTSGVSFVSSLGGVMLIGLGLFALNELVSEELKPRRRMPVKKAIEEEI
ncbi:MAG: hypothetical protein WDO14_07050 [Bacteroidota bacterium]